MEINMTIELIDETQELFFEKINTIDKPLARLTKGGGKNKPKSTKL